MKIKRSISADGFTSSNRRKNEAGFKAVGSYSAELEKQPKSRNRVAVQTASNGLNKGVRDLPPILIDEPESNRRPSKRKRSPKVKKKRSRAVRFLGWLVGLVLLGCGVYAGLYAYKIAQTSNKVFTGGWTGLFAHKPLKADATGRTNLLVFGTAEDDEGGKHGGPNLTDSIMIISFDKDNNDMAMLNLPRDLWIKHEKICTVGYQEKINTVYLCASDDGKNERLGAEALMRKVTEVTGIELQYYVHLNFGAVIGLVDAVGGVEVVIESSDRRGILDRNFDWKCNHKCYYVKYQNGPTGVMDGEHALALIRARNANGGYGLPNSNFDREKNQQKVVSALVEKMVTAGTLTDYNKFSKILDAVGDNLRTNFSSDEVRSAIDLAKKTKFGTGRSVSLAGDKVNLLSTGTLYGRSAVYPKAGMFDYAAIRKYIAKELLDAGLSEEAAKVGVFNASGESGMAKKLADKLKEGNVAVVQVGNAEKSCSTESGTAILSLNDDKPKTLARLKKITGGKVTKCSPEFNYDRTLDFLVVINGSESQ